VDALELIRLNLLSPVVLAFALGIVAAVVKSDLEIPEPLYQAISIYLLLAIGLKGGAELAVTPFSEVWAPALATVVLGVAIPLWCYPLLRRLGRFSVADAAALAAHYGSVSAVTFFATLSFLDAVGVPYEGFMPALVALLEVPAIVVALMIARTRLDAGAGLGAALHEVFTGKSVLLLLGGLLLGAASGPAGVAKVAPFFIDPFHGVLTLFLLEMGMVAARRLRDLRTVGPFLLVFAIVVPLIHGAVGVIVGRFAGLSLGGSTVFAVLLASASYIAAPTAVRIALPQANPGYYLTASLAITFPFNLSLGIPIFYALARWLHPGG